MDVVPVGFVVGEVPSECVLLREGHPRMFPNLRRTHEYGNLPLRKQPSFYFLAPCLFHRKEISLFISSRLACFIEKKYSMATWEHIKLGELPEHNALVLFYLGGSLKIHIEIKRELFTCQ